MCGCVHIQPQLDRLSRSNHFPYIEVNFKAVRDVKAQSTKAPVNCISIEKAPIRVKATATILLPDHSSVQCNRRLPEKTSGVPIERSQRVPMTWPPIYSLGTRPLGLSIHKEPPMNDDRATMACG